MLRSRVEVESRCSRVKHRRVRVDSLRKFLDQAECQREEEGYYSSGLADGNF